MESGDDIQVQQGRAMIASALLLLVAVSGCSGTPPGSHDHAGDQAPSSQDSENRWNAVDSDLPGKPIEGKKARIKEGIHIRPGIEFAELTVRESRENIEFTEDDEFAYVTGSAREKLEGKGRKDVLIGDGFIHQLDRSPIETDRGLKLDLRKFSLISVIWGDFKLDYPEDFDVPQESRPGPTPPYRTQSQAINMPTLFLDVAELPGPAGIEFTLGGSVDVDLRGPDVTGTFEGRIPIVAPDYDCDPPDHTLEAGCLLGRCAVDEDFCVEKIRISATMGLDAEADMSASIGGELTWGHPEEAPLNELIPPRDLGEVSIPSSPLSVGVEFIAGAKSQFEIEGEVDLDLAVNGDVSATTGVVYEDGEGVEPITDIDIRDSGGSVDVGTSAQAWLRHAIEAGLMWTVQPTGIGSSSQIEFDLEAVRTTLEARWDSIYSYRPVSQETAEADNNGVPPAVAGACARSKLVVSPFIAPEFSVDMGLNLAGYELGERITLFESSQVVWRPYQWPIASVDGGGNLCLTQQECEDQGRSDCDETVDVPDTGPGGGDQVETEPAFKIDASWKSDTDIDLEVRTPDGTHFGAGYTEESGAGKYPHDVCGGDIPCTDGDESNSESVIYHPADEAPDGTYQVKVTNDSGARAAEVDLQARTGGVIHDDAKVGLSASTGAFSGWIALEK